MGYSSESKTSSSLLNQKVEFADMQRLSIHRPRIAPRRPAVRAPVRADSIPEVPDEQLAALSYEITEEDSAASDDATKTGGGLPNIYRESYNKLARNWRMLGYTKEEIAELFGIAPGTINTWLVTHEKFHEAWYAGGPVADAKVARSLYKRAVGYRHPDVKFFYDKDIGVITVPFTKYYPPDVDAAKTWLFNRQRDLWQSPNKISDTVALALIANQTLVPPSVKVTVLGNPPASNQNALGGRVINGAAYHNLSNVVDAQLVTTPLHSASLDEQLADYVPIKDDIEDDIQP